jgi:hypothetical protein
MRIEATGGNEAMSESEVKKSLGELPEGFEWSGRSEIPSVGDRVCVGMNAIGWGNVTGYFTETATADVEYLGVEVDLDVLWNGGNGFHASVPVFGSELKVTEAIEPRAPIPAFMQVALAETAKEYPKDWKQRIRNAWFNGAYQGEGIGWDRAGALQCLRNSEFGHEFLDQVTAPLLLDRSKRKGLKELVAKFSRKVSGGMKL